MASLIGAIRNKLQTWVLGKSGHILGSIYSNPIMYGVQESFTEINFTRAVNEIFSKTTAVYAIVMKDAEKFGSIPRYYYTPQEREEKANRNETALTDLLNRPNKLESQDAFFTKIRAYFKVTGNAYIWLNRGDISRYKNADGSYDDMAVDKIPPLEMIVLPSHYCTPVMDNQDVFGVSGYELDLAGKKVRLRKGDVIHWKSTNLLFDATSGIHLLGYSPLSAGYKAIEEYDSLTNASVRQAQNDGARGVLTNESLGAMTPEQQSQLKAVIDKKINNNDVAGAIATLQGKWEYHDLGRSIRDLQILEGKELSLKEIFFLLKLPYEFYDSETTYANKEQAQVGWITNDMMPACKQLDGEFTRMLLKPFGLTGSIASDFSELPEIMKAMVDSAKSMQELPVTPNEVRLFMNLEEIDEPEMDEIWIGSTKKPLSQTRDIMDGGDELLNLNANARNPAISDGKISQNAARTPVQAAPGKNGRATGAVPKKVRR